MKSKALCALLLVPTLLAGKMAYAQSADAPDPVLVGSELVQTSPNGDVLNCEVKAGKVTGKFRFITAPRNGLHLEGSSDGSQIYMGVYDQAGQAVNKPFLSDPVVKAKFRDDRKRDCASIQDRFAALQGKILPSKAGASTGKVKPAPGSVTPPSPPTPPPVTTYRAPKRPLAQPSFDENAPTY